MHIYVHQIIYNRIKEIAIETNRSMAAVVEEACARQIGLGDIPLEDDTIFGIQKKEDKKE